MKQRKLVFSDDGFLIHVSVTSVMIAGNFYPRMHRSGEVDTFVPKALADMPYPKRYQGKGEVFGFAREDDALDFAQELCEAYFGKKAKVA